MKKEQERIERFVEQDAPGKNTDRAFVQVGKDGAPQFPDMEEASNQNESEKFRKSEIENDKEKDK